MLKKMKTQDMKGQVHYAPLEAIVNISKRLLSTSEYSVLNKGLKFSTTINRIPNLDLIVPIEEVALKIS